DSLTAVLGAAGKKSAVLYRSAFALRPGKEITGKFPQLAPADRIAQVRHQLQIEEQVVDRIEARGEDFSGLIEVPQICAAVVAAGIASAGLIERARVFAISAIADVDDAGRGEKVPIAGMTCRHHAVEQVDAPLDRGNDVLRAPYSHQVPRPL